MLVKEIKIKLFNTHNDDNKYLWADSSMPIDVQVEEALAMNKDKYLNAEVIKTYRLHSNTLYPK